MNLLQLLSNQPAHLIWLLGGLLCLGLSLIVPEPSVAAFGFAAIVTAIAALTIPSVATQLLIWGTLAISLAVIMRGMVPQESKDLLPSAEAEVSIMIPGGGVGHVAYEGTTWKARCQISDVSIPVGQRVQVVGRQENTLIVLPVPLSEGNFSDRTV